MANEISLETRASAAYVQGRLFELLPAWPRPENEWWAKRLAQILKDWKQAEAELKASKESE
mgnify:CR=1 FL=1